MVVEKKQAKNASWFLSVAKERQEEFKRDWINLDRFPTIETLLEKYREAATVSHLKYAAYRICSPKLPGRKQLEDERRKVELASLPIAVHSSGNSSGNSVIKVETILQNLPLEDRRWDDPLVLDANESAWKMPGQRVGRLSRLDYMSEGFRCGILQRGVEVLAREGVHFIVINAGLIDKDSFTAMLKKQLEGAKERIQEMKETSRKQGRKLEKLSVKRLRQSVLENLLDETTKALAAMLPKIKKPAVSNPGPNVCEYVRYYITTSPRYDGACGAEIARRLQKLRPDDIRCYKPGSARTKVKGVDKYIWSINQTRSRIPGKYYSQAAEKEINDKEAQTSQPPPDLWGVGGLGCAVYKGEGERKVAYITDPASSRQEKVTIGENQVGVAIVEYPPPDGTLVPGTVERRVRFWSFRDLIASERNFITGIKEGAGRIHHLIVEAIKNEGPLSVGQICDEIGIDDRKKVEDALKFLEEEKASQRKTWPGLWYNSESQTYDFHLDWLQNKLRYPALGTGDCREDTFLFTGCQHAGYTTVDYEFIVKQHPIIIQRNKTRVLVSLGDEIAGLHHGFQCTGEVFSSLNNTEQERFAAELRAEVIFRIFKENFGMITAGRNSKIFSADELKTIINEALILFLVIPGNHDLWSEQEGNTPLAMFVTRLRELLTLYISIFLAEKNLPTNAEEIAKIVQAKTKLFPDTEAVHEMPSGLRVAMAHPHMGRAATTSLRAQHAIGMLNAQVVGIANFHTAIVVHKWEPNLGQCVVIQVGTHAIYTRFEKRKMKFNVDFGPVVHRATSSHGRIIMTETVYYSKPYLKQPISKFQDINPLRKKLGLRCVELGLPLAVV